MLFLDNPLISLQPDCEQQLAEITQKKQHRKRSSVVVHYLDIVGVSFTPGKADPPTVVDANAVLAFTVALQRLQPVAANRAQVRQAGRSFEPSEPLSRLILDRAKLPAGKSLVNRLSLFAAERADHTYK